MRELTVIQTAKSLFYEKALVTADSALVGALAAIPKQSQNKVSDLELNYSEIFIRDNVPVMIYLLLEGKSEIVRHFLTTYLKLQSNKLPTKGIFPTSFMEKEGKITADYGQKAIGRVVSVDASLWWPVLVHIYVQKTKDYEWANSVEVQTGIVNFLDLIIKPTFRHLPTLYVTDAAFMIDRPLDVWGCPLEIQVLLYGALVCCAGLLDKSQANESRINYIINWGQKLRSYLLKEYWINSQRVQKLRRRVTEEYGERVNNEHNIQPEIIPHWLQPWLGDKGGYLIGNMRTGLPDYRFFTLGNCLAAIFDLITPAHQQSLFNLFLANRKALFAQMPLRICYPVLEGKDWEKKTGFDRKNFPYNYHNGGHWPCLLWYFTIAVLRHKQYHSRLIRNWSALEQLLEESYAIQLKRLPQQQWGEYFDGMEGNWLGQQARLNQTWTIVGFLLVHHFLKINPEDVNIMDLPKIWQDK